MTDMRPELSARLGYAENGLDRLDISGFINDGWDGYLSNAPDGSVNINFYNGPDAFTISLPGVTVGQIDASDYLL